MDRQEVYKRWASGKKSSPQEDNNKQLAQMELNKRQNLATAATVLGLPAAGIALSSASPYIIGQLAKTIAPMGAYEALNRTAQKEGHQSAEHKIVNDVFGKALPNDKVKGALATVLSFVSGIGTPKRTLNSLTSKQKEFWYGLSKGWLQYEDAAKNPKFKQYVMNNRFQNRGPSFKPDVNQIIMDKAIFDDTKKGSHPFRLSKTSRGWVAYINPDHPADPVYSGAKAAAEGALVNGTETWIGKSVFIPDNLKSLFNPDKQEDPLKTLASVMAAKVTSGVKSAYNEITDPEIYKVAQEGWKRGIWNSLGGKWNFDEFYKQNKSDLKKLLYRTPVVTGAGVLAIQNEKGDQ